MGRFSRRWAEAPGPNPLSRLLAEKRRAGLPILDLTDTNPTRAGLPAVAGLALPPQGTALYEPDPRGLLPAREAVSRYYAERGARVPPEDSVPESFWKLCASVSSPCGSRQVPATFAGT